MAEDVLKLSDLHVTFATPDGDVEAVKGIDLHIAPGETVAIVGESGSGKSQSVMASVGLLAKNGRASGSARYRGKEMIAQSEAVLNKIRGAKITMIFQEPMTSLDPLQTIETQIADPLVYHQSLSRQRARPRVLELLELVGIPDPERRLRSYPHELSGGQRQRVLIAMALANEPDLLIADEPTTALDVTIQAQILELLKDLQSRFGMAVLFITHDLGVVRRLADRVYVMRHGVVVEDGPAAVLMNTPAHAYTQELLDAEPTGNKPLMAQAKPPLLEAKNIEVTFALNRNIFGKARSILKAVDNISLSLQRGQTLGIVGESGSGKSTLGRALLGLLPSTGSIDFAGERLDGGDLSLWGDLRKRMQIVFQDPFGSLSPRLTVGEIIGEGLGVHEPGLNAALRQRRIFEAMNDVGLDPRSLRRYPHEFSGGQRQRIAIARAMVLRPEFLVLDEPTSALDRTVQKQVIELLRQLQAAHNLTYLFISHDLAVVRALADTVMVMKSGKIVEQGPAEEIFSSPQEAYTQALLKAAVLAPMKAHQ